MNNNLKRQQDLVLVMSSLRARAKAVRDEIDIIGTLAASKDTVGLKDVMGVAYRAATYQKALNEAFKDTWKGLLRGTQNYLLDCCARTHITDAAKAMWDALYQRSPIVDDLFNQITSHWGVIDGIPDSRVAFEHMLEKLGKEAGPRSTTGKLAFMAREILQMERADDQHDEARRSRDTLKAHDEKLKALRASWLKLFFDHMDTDGFDPPTQFEYMSEFVEGLAGRITPPSLADLVMYQ